MHKTKKQHRAASRLYTKQDAYHWHRRLLKEMRQSKLAATWQVKLKQADFNFAKTFGFGV